MEAYWALKRVCKLYQEKMGQIPLLQEEPE